MAAPRWTRSRDRSVRKLDTSSILVASRQSSATTRRSARHISPPARVNNDYSADTSRALGTRPSPRRVLLITINGQRNAAAPPVHRVALGGRAVPAPSERQSSQEIPLSVPLWRIRQSSEGNFRLEEACDPQSNRANERDLYQPALLKLGRMPPLPS